MPVPSDVGRARQPKKTARLSRSFAKTFVTMESQSHGSSIACCDSFSICSRRGSSVPPRFRTYNLLTTTSRPPLVKIGNIAMPAQSTNNDDDQRSTLLYLIHIAYSRMDTERLSCRRALTAAKKPLPAMPLLSGLCTRRTHSISDLQAIIKQLEDQTQRLITLTQKTRDLVKKKEQAEVEKLSQLYRAEMHI